MGFVVGDRHVLTCAHVVNAALGRGVRQPDHPGGEVRIPVDFPILGGADGAPTRMCVVERWLPPPKEGTVGDDFAGLVVVGEELPTMAGPARLNEQASPSPDEQVAVFGHPSLAERRSGTWAVARVRGRVGAGLLQVDADPAAAMRLQPGFSGSPLVVAGASGDSVIGMVVAAGRHGDHRDAYGFPTSRLVMSWPEALADVPPSPYRGLLPFTSADDAVFVGRETDTSQLREMVAEDGFVLVIGPSGVGKSSLVEAGLVPRWRDTGAVAVTVRPGSGAGSPARRLVGDVEAALRAAVGVDVWSLDIEPGPGALGAALSRRARATGSRVLVHIDQFEELLTDASADQRHELLELLVPTAREVADSCRIVATMRSDFVPMVLELPDQGPRLRHRMFALSPMGPAALERAVTEPALTRGVRYEDGLAAQIAADAGGATGSLPLMAFTLAQLWEAQRERRLTFADYRRFGGLAGAIDRHAERIYERLRRDGLAEQVKSVMLALVRTRGGAAEAGARPAPLHRFPGMRGLIDDLCRHRLLVLDSARADGEPLVWLSHESLIRSWSRFSRWVDDDVEFQRWLVTMEERAADNELIADTRLASAEQWLAERASDIPQEVADLIAASRSAWRDRIAELEEAKARAVLKAAEADARRLAAAAELAAMTKPGSPVPLVLAQRSIQALWTLEGDTALRRVLRRAPHPLVRLPDVHPEPDTQSVTILGDHLVRTVTWYQGGDRHRVRTELFGIDREAHRFRTVHEADDRVLHPAPGRVAVRVGARRVTVVDLHSGDTIAEDRDCRSVVASALSRDGTRLAIVRGVRPSYRPGQARSLSDATVRVIDLVTGRVRHTLDDGTLPDTGSLLTARNFTFSDDCTLLAATEPDGARSNRTVVYDLTGGRAPVGIPHDGYAWEAVAISPDNALLAVGVNHVDGCGDARSGAVEVFDLTHHGEQPGRLRFRLHQYTPVQALAFGQTADRLAVALGDTQYHRTPGAGLLIDVATGRELRRLHHDFTVDSVCLTTDGSRVAFAGRHAARVFDAATGRELARVDHEDEIADMTFGPDGRLLTATTTPTGAGCRLFEARGSEIARLDLTYSAQVFFTSDGGTALVTENDLSSGRTTVVDTATAARRGVVGHGRFASVRGSATHAHLVAVTHNGSASGRPGEVTIHDLSGEREPLTIPHQGYRDVAYVRFTDDGRRVVTSATTPTGADEIGRYCILVTDTRSGTLRSSIGITGYVIACSGDGMLAAVVSDVDVGTGSGIFRKTGDGAATGTVRIVNTADGVEHHRFRSRVDTALFAPDHTWVAVVQDGSVALMGARDGDVLCRIPLALDTPRNYVEIATSPNGRHLAFTEDSGARDGVFTLAETRTGTRIAVAACESAGSPAFCSDGTRATFVADGSARVVDVRTGTTLCVVEHDERVWQSVLSGAGGENLVTVGNHSLRVSWTDTATMAAMAKARQVRDLTRTEAQRYLNGSTKNASHP
nr:trypsin-like peptidase domain-containing protein [Streptomyces taklimakanensis]